MTNQNQDNYQEPVKIGPFPIGVVALAAIPIVGTAGWFGYRAFLGGNNSTPQTNQEQVNSNTENLQPQTVTTAPTAPDGRPQLAPPPPPVQVSTEQYQVNQNFTIQGSTSVNDLMASLPGVSWGATGSSAVIEELLKASPAVDMGVSSRPLTPTEKSQGLQEHQIGNDAIAFFVSPSNTAAPRDVDAYFLQSILDGSTADWGSLQDGSPGAIDLIVRGEGGTTASALEIFKITQFSPNAVYLQADSTTDVINALDTQFPLGIGFASGAQACTQSKADLLTINGESVSSPNYIAQRAIFIVTKGSPTPEQTALIETVRQEFNKYSAQTICR